jgi:hypothetical protein
MNKNNNSMFSTEKRQWWILFLLLFKGIREYTIWSEVSRLKLRCHHERTYRHKRRQKAVCCSLLTSISKMGRSGELIGLVIGWHFSKKSVRDIANPSQVSQVNGWWRDCEVETWRHNHNETMTGYTMFNYRQGPSSVEEGGSWNSPDIEWNNHPLSSAVLRIVQVALWLCVES